MHTWDWQIFLQDTGSGQNYLQWMFSAWGWTLSVAACALLVGMVVGITVGILRTLPQLVFRLIGESWTELFRNIPLLVQLFLWYQVIPVLFPTLKFVPNFLLVVIGLGFFTSARISEQVKAGLKSISRGQESAGLAIGLTLIQTYRYILLPLALRRIIPLLTSESMTIIKNSSVAFAVNIAELAFFANEASEETSHTLEVYLAVTVLYFISSFAVGVLGNHIEKRTQLLASSWKKLR